MDLLELLTVRARLEVWQRHGLVGATVTLSRM
jgi:hypothetical protein